MRVLFSFERRGDWERRSETRCYPREKGVVVVIFSPCKALFVLDSSLRVCFSLLFFSSSLE